MGAAVEAPGGLGAYLTDEVRLLKVVGASAKQKDHPPMLMLEDCGDPCEESAVFWIPVRDVLGWRRVVPAVDAALSSA